MLKKFAVLLLFILVIYVANAFLNPFPSRNVPEGFNPKYGTSFSFEQSGWYGQDPHKSFEKLITEHKFDWVRVPFFWDQMTDSDGNLKIDDLKFAAETAKAHNTKLIIAIGAKTPYHPEYHIPASLSSKLKFGDTIDANHAIASDILAINKKVVIALSAYESIGWWQVENEPYLANINNWQIDKEFLKKEVGEVRNSDPKKRPIILVTHSPHFIDGEWKDFFEILKPGDVFGINVFFKVQGPQLISFSIFGRETRIVWPKGFSMPAQSWLLISPDFLALKKYSESRNVEMWVMEMQAEPYIRTLEDAKRTSFEFTAGDISKADNFLKTYRIKSVGLWGANFWQFRESLGDESWMKAVDGIINN